MRRNLMATLGLAAAAVAGSAAAQSPEETWDGRTLTILIGHPPGGSYDLYAQLAAEHLGEHLPGEPNVIVQHMPGGGGLRAASYFMNNMEGDGLTVAVLPDTLGHVQQLTPERADWDASKIRYVGRFAPANAAFAMRTDAPAKTIEDMKEIETIVACTGRNARSAQQPSALKNVAGLNLRVICGYKGSNAAELAVVRGEADVMTQNWASFAADPAHLDSGAMKIVLQAGLERDPDLPDVPLMQEVVDDPEGQRVLRFVSAGAPIGRSMMAHPDTPEPLIEALREGFAAMVEDPDFRAAAEQRGAIINYAPGEEVEAVMQEIMSASPELIAAATQAMDTSDADEVAQ